MARLAWFSALEQDAGIFPRLGVSGEFPHRSGPILQQGPRVMPPAGELSGTDFYRRAKKGGFDHTFARRPRPQRRVSIGSRTVRMRRLATVSSCSLIQESYGM